MKSLNVLTLWDTVLKVSCCVVLCTPAVKCNPCLFYPPLNYYQESVTWMKLTHTSPI